MPPQKSEFVRSMRRWERDNGALIAVRLRFGVRTGGEGGVVPLFIPPHPAP